MARIAAKGVEAHPNRFHPTIAWWVRRPEMADEINQKRTNSQYLGDAHLPEQLHASTNLKEVVDDASVCIMGLPGEFLPPVLRVLDEGLRRDSVVVSLIKSLKLDGGHVLPYTEMMSNAMGGRAMAALMGPNIYREMAVDQFAEATIGCRQEALWPMLKDLFETENFHVDLSKDLIGVEMCGCMKNTVTISCGIAAGLGWGSNVKAAIIRRGLLEIGKFIEEFTAGEAKVILETCGVGDVVLSCYAGRGQALATAFVQAGGAKSWEAIEDEIMGGMKIPDWKNVRNVYELLSGTPGALERYPLLTSTYRIAFEGAPAETILDPLRGFPK